MPSIEEDTMDSGVRERLSGGGERETGLNRFFSTSSSSTSFASSSSSSSSPTPSQKALSSRSSRPQCLLSLSALVVGVAVVAALVPCRGVHAAAYRPGAYPHDASKPSCPIAAAKSNFDLSKFLGDWYVLAYEYPKKMRLKDISCVGLHFSLTEFGDVTSNFTFRFPAQTGFFYHVPTFSFVSESKPSLWDTQLRGVELISAIVDTDYDNWAILVQCQQLPSAGGGLEPEPHFLSTRVLSRTRSLSTDDFMRAQAAIEAAEASADYRYPVDQDVCEELDGGEV